MEGNKKLLTIVLGVVFLILAGVLVKRLFFETPGALSVVGEGSVKTEPKMVTFSVTTLNTAPSASQVITDSNKLVVSLVNILTKNGVAPSDISYPFPVVAPPQASLGETNYQAANSLEVSFKNINNFEGLVYQLYAAGARNVTNIVFTTENSQDLEKQAVDKAIANAKARAKEIAKSSGKSLGKMVSLTTAEAGSAGTTVGEAPKQDFTTETRSTPSQIEIFRQASIIFEIY